MFLGHLAVGLGAKRVAPAVSLGALTLAALWPDLLLPTLVLAGVETVRVAPGITAVSPFDFSVSSPPPPDASAFARGGQASWLLVVWALWVDRHRSPTSAAA
jgi:hypothetical protein